MKSLKLVTAVTVLLSGLIATSAFAQRNRGEDRRVVLDFYDQEFRGQNTLALKREIRHQFPNINLRRFSLGSVRLVAKSRQGRGQASLVIGRDQTRNETVYGNPRDYNDPSPRTFDRINFRNPSYDGQGRWQIHMRGNIVVRKVVVFLSRTGSGRPEMMSIRCESVGYRYKECLTRGNIARANLSRQLSNSACIEGRTWGATRNSIWVSDGCRAIFRVETRSRS